VAAHVPQRPRRHRLNLRAARTASRRRNEVIVLLTPTIVRDPGEGRTLTDEYARRFRAMAPLQRAKAH
jgi:general secretion pathway protein D